MNFLVEKYYNYISLAFARFWVILCTFRPLLYSFLATTVSYYKKVSSAYAVWHGFCVDFKGKQT